MVRRRFSGLFGGHLMMTHFARRHSGPRKIQVAATMAMMAVNPAMMIFLSSMFPLLMGPMYHGSSRIFTVIFDEICVKTGDDLG